MDFPEFHHDDFKVVRQDKPHGGFEEVERTDGLWPVGCTSPLFSSNIQRTQDLCFFRKGITPMKHEEFEKM